MSDDANLVSNEQELKDQNPAPTAPEGSEPDKAEDQPTKSIKELVEAKGLDVLLSADNKTLSVKSTMSFSNSGKKSIEDYKPTEKELELINTKYSNSDLSRR